jgi:FSR family fosmidomycin resistance protein-like MFS transporter
MTAEAVAKAKSTDPQQFQTDGVVTVSAAHAVHDTYSGFLPPLLPAFIETLSLSRAEAGSLMLFVRAPSLLQPFIGHLDDRISLRYLVILTPAVTATAMSLLGVAPGYVVMALLLLVAGLSSATLHSVAPVMAGRLSGQSLGRGMGFWMVGGELGRFLGPLVIAGYFRIYPDNLSNTWWLMFGGWLASFLLWVRLRGVSGRREDAGLGLDWRQALRAMRPILLPLGGVVLLRSFLNASLMIYLPTFLREEGAALWLASISLSVLEAAGIVGALTGGSLSDRLGRKKVLFGSLLVTPLLTFAFLIADGWLRYPLLLGLGLFGLAVVPVIMAMMQESFPENRAFANGVYMAFSFVVGSVAVVAVGAMGDLLGMTTAFAISAVLMLLGLPFVPKLPTRNT